MVRVRAICNLSGPGFSPRAAESQTGLQFTRKSEPGEISDLERYQGKSANEGRAELLLQEYGQVSDLLSKNQSSLDALARSLDALRRAGATDMELRFDVEVSGANVLEMPAELLRKLGDLGLSLSIHTFDAQETEEMSKRGLL